MFRVQGVVRGGPPEVRRSNKRFHVAMIVVTVRQNPILLRLAGSQPVNLEPFRG